MEEGRSLTWISLLCFTLALSSTSVIGRNDDFSITCDTSSTKLSLRTDYLEAFVDGDAHAVYLVDATNSQKVSDCVFTKGAEQFTFIVDESNVDTCFVTTTNDGDSLTNTFLACLAPGPMVGAAIKFQEKTPCWTFTCTYDASLKVSNGGAVEVLKPTLNFNSMQLQDFDVTARFNSRPEFSEEFDRVANAVEEGATVYLFFDLIGSSSLRLSLIDCTLHNTMEGVTYEIIKDGCPVMDGVDELSRLDDRRIVLSLQAFRHHDDGNELFGNNHFFTVRCTSDLRDNSVVAVTPDPTCNRRIRRSSLHGRKGIMTVETEASFYVIPQCQLKCSYKCGWKGHAHFCECQDGLELEADRLTCKEIEANAIFGLKISNNQLESSDEQQDGTDDQQEGTVRAVESKSTIPKPSTAKSSNTTPRKRKHRKKKKTKPAPKKKTKPAHKKRTKPAHKKKTKPIVSHTLPRKSDHHIYQAKHSQYPGGDDQSNNPNKSEKTKDAVKTSSILLYSTFVITGILCLLLIVMIVQKCRQLGQPYQVFNSD